MIEGLKQNAWRNGGSANISSNLNPPTEIIQIPIHNDFAIGLRTDKRQYALWSYFENQTRSGAMRFANMETPQTRYELVFRIDAQLFNNKPPMRGVSFSVRLKVKIRA